MSEGAEQRVKVPNIRNKQLSETVGAQKAEFAQMGLRSEASEARSGEAESIACDRNTERANSSLKMNMEEVEITCEDSRHLKEVDSSRRNES